MKNLLLIFLAITFSSQITIAQNDTLNRFDQNHKKTGWWVDYLDKNLASTEDTSEAKYYRYSYYEGKFDYYNMGRIGSEKHAVIAPESNISQNKIQALNGEYKVNYDNGQTKYFLSAKNGRFLEYKEYYDNGNLKTHFDYTKSCGDTPFEYCIYLYKKDGTLIKETTLQTP